MPTDDKDVRIALLENIIGEAYQALAQHKNTPIDLLDRLASAANGDILDLSADKPHTPPLREI